MLVGSDCITGTPATSPTSLRATSSAASSITGTPTHTSKALSIKDTAPQDDAVHFRTTATPPSCPRARSIEKSTDHSTSLPPSSVSVVEQRGERKDGSESLDGSTFTKRSSSSQEWSSCQARADECTQNRGGKDSRHHSSEVRDGFAPTCGSEVCDGSPSTGSDKSCECHSADGSRSAVVRRHNSLLSARRRRGPTQRVYATSCDFLPRSQ